MNTSTPKSQRYSAGIRELYLEFVQVDRNRDGKVDYEEFKEMLAGLDAGMSETDVFIGFHEVDTDKNGFIGCDEFVEWWLAD